MDTTKLPYSGVTSSYLHKHHPTEPNPPEVKAGLRKVWYLDAQWSTCPREVEDVVRDLWQLNELGNDRYMLQMSVNDLLAEQDSVKVSKVVDGVRQDVPVKVDYLVQYIREHGIPDDETVIIHWWW